MALIEAKIRYLFLFHLFLLNMKKKDLIKQ